MPRRNRRASVLDCGGRDTAFVPGSGAKMTNINASLESGGALRLPPHSTTTSDFSGSQAQDVLSPIQSIEQAEEADFHVLALV